MPVLRSREIPSPQPPQSKSPSSSSSSSSRKTLENKPQLTPTVVEPVTPAKTGESVSQSPTPPYRRRSRRLAGGGGGGDDDGAVVPSPKRSRSGAASETKELGRIEGGKQEIEEIGGLNLRSGARVSRRASLSRNCNLTESKDDSVDDDVRVSDVDLDSLIEKVVLDIQELGRKERNNQGIDGARVSEKRLIDGDGNVDELESKEEEDGALKGGGSMEKTVNTTKYGEEEKGKGKLIVDDQLVDGFEEALLHLSCVKKFDDVSSKWGKWAIDDQGVVHDIDDSGHSSRRYTRDEKGKAVHHGDHEDDDAVLEKVGSERGLNFDVVEDNGIKINGETNESGNTVGDLAPGWRQKNVREIHKRIAKENALKYAHYNAEEDGGQERGEEDGEDLGDAPSEDCNANIEDWPGPFSTAMKIVRDREKNLGKQAQNSSLVKGDMSLISWSPKKERGIDFKKERTPPSLKSMCMKVLSQHVEMITSLMYVPDVLRHKLCQMLCDSRRMNAKFFHLLLQGSPTEIRVSDCSWLKEDNFENSINTCNTSSLMVLQLDLCGHCVSDASLLKAVAQKGFPMLTTISLKGACRISDTGLDAIVSAAPVLRSLNLSQCSLLTDVGIKTIADKLGSIVHELYLDDCDTLDAMSILPSLKRLLCLEVLSLRGIGGVTDIFIRLLLTSNGHNMKELVLANCVNLSNASLKVIAEKCPQLCVLDLSYLRKLTDIGMAHLANGCRGIQELRLCCNAFSDDAIAAFLEASGERLRELSLNNITKVGQNTTISLARRCKNLEFLDLSWCRSLTDEALGLIADSCMSLRLLKIFGCTQITRTFIDGHSNPHLHVVGMKLTPILDHIKRPDFQQGPLYYSAVPPS